MFGPSIERRMREPALDADRKPGRNVETVNGAASDGAQLAVGPPVPNLVPQQPGSGASLSGQWLPQPQRFVFKKAHVSADDFRCPPPPLSSLGEGGTGVGTSACLHPWIRCRHSVDDPRLTGGKNRPAHVNAASLAT